MAQTTIVEGERHGRQLRPEGLEHPIGTLAIVGAYGLLFALGWLLVYFLIYIPRGSVTP